jgi:hypothetical protein
MTWYMNSYRRKIKWNNKKNPHTHYYAQQQLMLLLQKCLVHGPDDTYVVLFLSELKYLSAF